MASTSSGERRPQEAVHHLAPGPEAVGLRPAPLGKSGHAALEGVAMQVRNAGDGDAGQTLGTLGTGAVGDCRTLPPSTASRTSRAQPVGSSA